jgi:hypothetical protein
MGRLARPSSMTCTAAFPVGRSFKANASPHGCERWRSGATRVERPNVRRGVGAGPMRRKSVKEVAEIVGIAPATVKTRMFYARKKLADFVAAA